MTDQRERRTFFCSIVDFAVIYLTIAGGWHVYIFLIFIVSVKQVGFDVKPDIIGRAPWSSHCSSKL